MGSSYRSLLAFQHWHAFETSLPPTVFWNQAWFCAGLIHVPFTLVCRSLTMGMIHRSPLHHIILLPVSESDMVVEEEERTSSDTCGVSIQASVPDLECLPKRLELSMPYEGSFPTRVLGVIILNLLALYFDRPLLVQEEWEHRRWNLHERVRPHSEAREFSRRYLACAWLTIGWAMIATLPYQRINLTGLGLTYLF